MDGVAGETMTSSTVAVGAGACFECLNGLGLSGELAAALAVLIAVVSRMIFDYQLTKKRINNE